MRKGNVTILASIFMMLLVAMGVGAGTTAWFSTTRTASVSSIKTGTLSMSNPTVAFYSAAPDNWAPGESFTVEFKIENTGTLDIYYIGGNLEITYDPKNLAEVIEVTSIYEGIPGYGWQESIGGTQSYETLVLDEQAPLTLLELAQSYIPSFGEPANTEGPYDIGGTSYTFKLDPDGKYVKSLTDWVTGYGYDIVPEGQPCLKVGGTYTLQLTLKLMGPETTNAHQNAPLQFKITFVGVRNLAALP